MHRLHTSQPTYVIYNNYSRTRPSPKITHYNKISTHPYHWRVRPTYNTYVNGPLSRWFVAVIHLIWSRALFNVFIPAESVAIVARCLSVSLVRMAVAINALRCLLRTPEKSAGAAFPIAHSTPSHLFRRLSRWHHYNAHEISGKTASVENWS